ncbi:hypothetical protein [Bifidobacterium sp. ESL0732]|uniref:hypothetical protein n=1 Tax=Bifidobacterium sp. ESL0732 TaxID=2983222 RepID=UPI0023F6506B|nr:hypothetical protein [Bifidobacterium sp. ESL0732]WEV63278.1 hypothetical protein OZX70_04655 [Bifidobacterium sp. ESL0732]
MLIKKNKHVEPNSGQVSVSKTNNLSPEDRQSQNVRYCKECGCELPNEVKEKYCAIHAKKRKGNRDKIVGAGAAVGAAAGLHLLRKNLPKIENLVGKVIHL